jgi:DNA-directed RNA polymerase subunit M
LWILLNLSEDECDLVLETAEKAKVRARVRKRGVRFCPKCGSTAIHWARGLPQLWSIWECRNCGYYGAFIVEDGKMSKKLQEEYRKKYLRKRDSQT